MKSGNLSASIIGGIEDKDGIVKMTPGKFTIEIINFSSIPLIYEITVDGKLAGSFEISGNSVEHEKWLDRWTGFTWKPFEFFKGEMTVIVRGNETITLKLVDEKHAPVKKIDPFVIVRMALDRMPDISFHTMPLIDDWVSAFVKICVAIREQLGS